MSSLAALRGLGFGFVSGSGQEFFRDLLDDDVLQASQRPAPVYTLPSHESEVTSDQ